MAIKKQKIVIGLGTGRTGSKSFSELLNLQDGVKFTHEAFKLPWKFSKRHILEVVGALFSRINKDNRVIIEGDISPWYLSYVKFLDRLYPNFFKFVCLYRDIDEVVKSYIKKVPLGNHWTKRDSDCYENPTRESAYDKCYPKYDLPKKDAVRKYCEEYEDFSLRLSKEMNNFGRFNISVLSNKDYQLKLFKFLELDSPKTCTTIHLNKGRRLRLPLWSYWDKPDLPPLINLCYETKVKNSGSTFDLIHVNENTVKEYLPDINPKVYWLISEKTGETHPWMIADYIRVKLLEKYGGVWLDSDCIQFNDLSRIGQLLLKHDYVGLMTDNGYISLGFMASKPNGNLMSRYSKEMDNVLEVCDSIPSSSYWGSRLLTKIHKSNGNSAVPICFVDKEKVAPIEFRNFKMFLSTTYPIEKVINKNSICCLWYNRLFDDTLRNAPREQILWGGSLISRLLKRALKVEDFYG
jgi:hypothetical protein